MTDMGVTASRDIIADVKARARREDIKSMAQLTATVEEAITAILKPCERNIEIPHRDPTLYGFDYRHQR